MFKFLFLLWHRAHLSRLIVATVVAYNFTSPHFLVTLGYAALVFYSTWILTFTVTIAFMLLSFLFGVLALLTCNFGISNVFSHVVVLLQLGILKYSSIFTEKETS